VREVAEEESLQGVVRYQDMIVPVPDVDALFAFLRAQVGSRYDFAGALGIPLLYSTDWQDWSRWWCSELVFAALGAGGVWLLDPAEVTRVTPNDLHQCNFMKLSHTVPPAAGFLF
jgi:hypothetical protein